MSPRRRCSSMTSHGSGTPRRLGRGSTPWPDSAKGAVPGLCASTCDALAARSSSQLVAVVDQFEAMGAMLAAVEAATSAALALQREKRARDVSAPCQRVQTTSPASRKGPALPGSSLHQPPRP